MSNSLILMRRGRAWLNKQAMMPACYWMGAFDKLHVRWNWPLENNVSRKNYTEGAVLDQYIQYCMLKLTVWACNKLPFFKPIENLNLYKCKQSQFTCFCVSNINQTFTNSGGMIWGVGIVIFTEIRHLVEELITCLSIFWPQKLCHLTTKLNI